MSWNRGGSVGRPLQGRPAPGLRPVPPVRLEEKPDDWLCSWVYHLVSCEAGKNGTGYWELKYINAACLEHARLATAAV